MEQIPTVNVPEVVEPQRASIDFSALTKEQAEWARSVLRSEELGGMYGTIGDVATAVNQLGKLVGGFTSNDLEFDHNPATGRTSINIKTPFSAEDPGEDGGAGLPDPTTFDLRTGAYVSKVVEVANKWYLADADGVSTGVLAEIITRGSEGEDEDGDTRAWVVDYVRLVDPPEVV